jgi:hypothetical protein
VWQSNLLVLELGLELDTRVRDVSTFLNGVLLGNTSSVLEEHDTLVVLDELILAQFIQKIRNVRDNLGGPCRRKQTCSPRIAGSGDRGTS